ncbi:hypothetical protein [Cupriavidus sp. a3]|uniref:hypothetical protein n=1 Tax=Cupriavidus sp. a3 TaxID=3242158 RepID=UPI003D9C5BE5
MTIEKLQHLCQTARSLFGTEELIIAGGAPRDTLSGVQVKDIDIFVRIEWEEGEDTQFTHNCKILAAWLMGEAEFRPANEDYGNLLDLCDIKGANAHGLIQVIGLDRDPIGDVHSYDFGLSQVFVTPSGLFYTENAVKDRANKTITHFATYENDAGFLRSKARYGRLLEKYAGWRFVNCEALEGDSMPVEIPF